MVVPAGMHGAGRGRGRCAPGQAYGSPLRRRRAPSLGRRRAEADGGEGGDHLEQDPVQGQVGDLEQDQGGDADDGYADEGHRHAHPYCRGRDPAAEGLDVLIPAGLGQDGQDQHGEGGDLNAPGGRGGAPAHEHEDVLEQPGGLVHVLGGDEGQTRGAGVDAVDQGGQEFAAGGQGPVGARIAPLQGRDGDRRDEAEAEIGGQGDLGVQAPGPGPAPVAGDVEDDGEADRAHDGAQDDGQTHPPVRGVGGQPLGHDHEARIVEDGQGHEQRVPQRMAQIQAADEEAWQQGGHEHQLASHRGVDDGAQQGAHVPQARLVLLVRHHPLGQANLARDHQGKQGGDGHDAQAAHGGPQDDDGLAEG